MLLYPKIYLIAWFSIVLSLPEFGLPSSLKPELSGLTKIEFLYRYWEDWLEWKQAPYSVYQSMGFDGIMVDPILRREAISTDNFIRPSVLFLLTIWQSVRWAPITSRCTSSKVSNVLYGHFSISYFAKIFIIIFFSDLDSLLWLCCCSHNPEIKWHLHGTVRYLFMEIGGRRNGSFIEAHLHLIVIKLPPLLFKISVQK